MNNTIQIIKNIRQLYLDPSTWTKGAFARDADGTAVGSFHPNARCWCLAGAVYKYSFPNYESDVINFINKELPLDRAIVQLNDIDGYEAVCNLLDKIINKYS